jgi:hypothetical protein
MRSKIIIRNTIIISLKSKSNLGVFCYHYFSHGTICNGEETRNKTKTDKWAKQRSRRWALFIPRQADKWAEERLLCWALFIPRTRPTEAPLDHFN